MQASNPHARYARKPKGKPHADQTIMASHWSKQNTGVLMYLGTTISYLIFRHHMKSDTFTRCMDSKVEFILLFSSTPDVQSVLVVHAWFDGQHVRTEI